LALHLEGFALLGLREGIIGTLLERLDRDPLSRLVMPKYALQAPLGTAFLAALRGQAEETIPSPVPSRRRPPPHGVTPSRWPTA
jgi:hypothetical protein